MEWQFVREALMAASYRQIVLVHSAFVFAAFMFAVYLILRHRRLL